MRAWHLLSKKHAPKTIHTFMGLMCEVYSAKRVMYMKDFAMHVNLWGDKLAKLLVRGESKMTDTAKIAIFINMAPATSMDYTHGVLEKNMD